MTSSDKEQEKKRFPIDAVLFDLVILGFFLLLAIVSMKYNPRARSIPLGLGVLGSIMTFMQLLVDALPWGRSKFRFVASSGLLAQENRFPSKESDRSKAKELAGPADSDSSSQEKERTSPAEWLRVFRVVLWLVGFIILLGFTNYLIAVGAFVVLVTKLEAKESWKRALILGLCVNLGFFILFELLLQAQL
ncbi:MAG: tripartite tricarboxylate transporter TctB family protein [Pseudomonadota bacterium]